MACCHGYLYLKPEGLTSWGDGLGERVRVGERKKQPYGRKTERGEQNKNQKVREKQL